MSLWLTDTLYSFQSMECYCHSTIGACRVLLLKLGSEDSLEVIGKMLVGGVGAVWLYLLSAYMLLHFFRMPIGYDDSYHLMTELTQVWSYLLDGKVPVFISWDALSARGLRHLMDVKYILQYWYYGLCIVSPFFILLLGIAWYRGRLCSLLWVISIFLIMFLLFLVIIATVNFKESFDFIHQLVFKEGSWYFYKSSLLIKLFPLEYFKQFFFIHSLFLFSLSVMSIFICKRA